MSEPWDDLLDEAMSGPEPDWDEPCPVPDNADDANRLLWRLARIERKESEMLEVVTAQRARLDAFEAGASAAYQRQRKYITDTLAAYHRAVLSRSPRSKTIELPNGTLRARAQQPAWDFPDEDAFKAWAEVNAPELLRQPEPRPVEVDRAAVKKALATQEDRDYAVDINGEHVPGVVVTFREPRYTIEATA